MQYIYCDELKHLKTFLEERGVQLPEKQTVVEGILFHHINYLHRRTRS